MAECLNPRLKTTMKANDENSTNKKKLPGLLFCQFIVELLEKKKRVVKEHPHTGILILQPGVKSFVYWFFQTF